MFTPILNKFYLKELLIIILFVVAANQFFKEKPLHINADGKGYYDYLPASFIYHDLEWKHFDTLVTEFYDHTTYPNIYYTIDGHKVNKYFIGTSILMSPFFFGAYLYEESQNIKIDGYSASFQNAIYIAALFYLFIGLIFIGKFLYSIQFNSLSIFISQFAITFATPIIYYVYYQSSFSHIYSFALISAFIYYSYTYTKNKKISYFLISFILLGLIILVRPVNAIIISIIPFYFCSFHELADFVKNFFKKNFSYLFYALLIIASIGFIQPIFWYLQTGSLFIDSYGNESFNFLKPEIFNILFSYKKGLFVYSPILFFIVLGGIVTLVIERKYYKLTTLLIPLFIIIYILSSWWNWWYAMSYGQRPFVDFLPIFAIFSAYFLNYIRKWMKISMVVLILVASSITFIQVDQYKRYILHWEGMNKDSFWMVFLKTHEKYRGMLWKRDNSYTDKQIVGNFYYEAKREFSPDCWCEILNINKKDLSNNFNLVHVQASVDLFEDSTRIYMSIEDSVVNNLQWHEQYVFTGIEQRFFYKEINTGVSNLYFYVDNLPENYSVIKIGFKTYQKNMTLREIKTHFINK